MMIRSLLSLILTLLLPVGLMAQDYKDFDAGVAKFRAGEYSRVVEMFSAMLDNPRHDKRFDEDLYFYRGRSYFHVNDFAKALDDLNQSLALNHYNRGILHLYMARCYDKLGKKDEAISNYKEALSVAEKNKRITAEILVDRAGFFARQGDKVASEQDLAQAKMLDPGNKNIPASIAAATAPNTGVEEKKTQVIIQNNTEKRTQQPAATTVTTAQQTAVAPATTPSRSNTDLIASLAEAYKDEKRYALVIGNSSYGKTIGELKNPLNDATDVATELRKSNFEVQLLTNATYVQMREAMRKFQEKLTEGPRDQTVGLFYYAGHGVAYQDENYLVPIDADVKYEDDIGRMCFPVQRMVLANMERSNSRMNIVILDACRNNPFPSTSRSVSSGLGEMKRARGSFIAYATSPGSVASDGSGRNGLYTQELLKALRKPGLSIEQVFKEVRMNVLRLSGDKQYTWDSSNIIGEFYFKFR